MTTPRRVRTIDLENPFAASFDGMCEILLVRHGEQKFHENIKLGDALDAPLSEMGWKQARAVGERLAPARIGMVFVSPMRRAFDTGNEIARHHNLTPVVREDLREIDLWQKAPQDKGLLELYEKEELAEIYRNVSRSRKHSAYPHVEDVDSFRTRVVAAIDQIAEEGLGHRVVIACHGGVINAYLSHMFGSYYDHLVAVHHTSITVVRAADTRRAVLTINDYSHVMPIQSHRGDINA
ncbi:MAG: histidine phosphatase family protein [Dehalococcoidia bacterium]|nr:histidine phosphatase family protein [Chloroflexi bacterium CFX7]MCK6564423.1 histidine phosphatase family protein [Dehalococcoidia bacterium]NUQ54755.1 histidine phosphatase family protein [Dehalococcoidia bacterium]RIL01987.1 MAG: histidine phosphatase family protein [bacterium]